KYEIKLGLTGKYAQLRDAYASIEKAVEHCGAHLNAKVEIDWIDTTLMKPEEATQTLKSFNGVIVPGGFGHRGIEGKIDAVKFARERDVPFFGICLGMQCAVIEYARNVLGLPQANSTEFDGNTPDPVICLLEEQRTVTDKGGTMRLGAQPCLLEEGSGAEECYGTTLISERHRHRYEFNPAYRDRFVEAGLVPTGRHAEGDLVEVIEVPENNWFLAAQFHPEFKSKPDQAHPLFAGFVEAAIDRKNVDAEARLMV
ncbi:MAG: CTP synthase, partial [Planctomycetota bacterium]